jgi:hypothetical protein
MSPAIVATYLSSFSNVTVSTIKDTNRLHVTLFEFGDYAVPTEDVSMWMGHRCKMKALGYEGAIAIRSGMSQEN